MGWPSPNSTVPQAAGHRIAGLIRTTPDAPGIGLTISCAALLSAIRLRFHSIEALDVADLGGPAGVPRRRLPILKGVP